MTKKVATITPRQFAAKLRKINEEYGWDKEKVHRMADELMADTLKSLGYGNGIKIYTEEINKWYS